jgi:hypothetical protein
MRLLSRQSRRGVFWGIIMANGSAGPGVTRRMVDKAWSAKVAPTDPDDPVVQGFAEFGLPSSSSLTTGDQLRDLETWRDNLRIPANSAFLDGTLLLTVEALLSQDGPDVLTPVTLWELTTFIDALTCFDRLYCIANPRPAEPSRASRAPAVAGSAATRRHRDLSNLREPGHSQRARSAIRARHATDAVPPTVRQACC